MLTAIDNKNFEKYSLCPVNSDFFQTEASSRAVLVPGPAASSKTVIINFTKTGESIVLLGLLIRNLYTNDNNIKHLSCRV